jgi:sodium/hydrogen exchanger 10/11
MAEGVFQSAGTTVVLFCKLALSSTLLGIGFGLASALWLGYSFDVTTEFMITLTTAYFTYYVAELLQISGLLAVGSC